jgi:hypothetical protein
MSSLSDIYERLGREWCMLESHWQSTRRQWSDAVGDRFEKEYWREMEEKIPVFLRELQHVDQTLEQALKNLS